MKAAATRYRDVRELQLEFERRRSAIRRRLEEFAAVPPGDYFYELVYCLLTPQSSAVNAARVAALLKGAGFPDRDLDPVPFLRRKDSYIRFHNTKGKRILELRAKFPAIAPALSGRASSRELRTWLHDNVRGLGLKESSHFLRNIGHRDLAILDRHILRNLVKHGVLRTIPKTMTARHYLEIEARFALFAKSVGITLDELDLLFWSRETGKILK